MTEKTPSVLRVPLKALQLVGMWPVISNNVFINFLLRIYFLSSATCLGLCSLGLFVKTLKTNDLVDRSEAIDIFTLTLSAMYKQIFFAKHYSGLNRLVVDCDKLVVPKNWLQFAPLLATGHCICGFFAITFWWACPILKVTFGDSTISEIRLPMNIYEWSSLSGWNFVITYVICCFGLNLSTQIYMAVDCFLFTAVHTANGALQQLATELTSLRTVRRKEKETVDEVRLRELNKCIKTHAFIMEYLAQVDHLFRSMILADVLHAIISLSFAMLQLSESKGILEWTKMVLFVFYCIVHQYLNSFFGQVLIDQQEALQHVIEEIPWEESNLPIRSSTLIIMTAATKPVKLSAWRMYFLQFATFAEFIKNMISTYMVLQQLQDDSIN